MPTALAAPALQAEALNIAGTTTVSGDAVALFASATQGRFSWEIAAASATLHRVGADYAAVHNPTNDQYLYKEDPEWGEQKESLRDLVLTSTGVDADGALLVLGDAALAAAATDALVQIHSTSDPTIEQVPAEVELEGADRGYIRAQLEGDFLQATFAEGTITIQGDFTLVLFGPSYTAEHAAGASEERTGAWETRSNGVMIEGRIERHTLTLTDALMQLHAPAGAELFSRAPQIDFEGTVQAERASGGLLLGGREVRPASDGGLTWSGATSLALSPAAGRVLATTPEPTLAASGAIVSQGPSVTFVSVALVLAGAVALALVVALRRRTRAGDLDAALLAMEERRWEDALPPLTRLARRRPTDSGVQIDRALCLEQVGRFEEAAKAFERALRHAPQHAEAHFYYARTLAKMRESEAARVHLEAALERDPRLVELARSEKVLRGL